MKQVFLSYHDVHTDCIKLAKLIKKKYKPKKLILISRGGLIPGSIIANYLGIQDIDVIALKTYSDRRKNTDIKIFKRIKSEKKLVVIDDLVDSGETAKIVKDMMPNSKFVVLYAKTSGKNKPIFIYMILKIKTGLFFLGNRIKYLFYSIEAPLHLYLEHRTS